MQGLDIDFFNLLGSYFAFQGMQNQAGLLGYLC
jgi:hypothetical protein